MKKLHLLVLSVIMSLSFLALSGCSSESQTKDTICDIEALHVGDAIPCYPNCAFNYEYVDSSGETYVFHISKLSMTFAGKHAIAENSTISDSFRLYEVTVSAIGYTDQSLAGRQFTMELYGANISCLFDCVISDNGEFSGEKAVTHNARYLSTIVFGRISGLRHA